MQIDKIFRTAVQYKASDIYITTGSKPVLRINGDLILIEEHPVFTKKMAEEYLLEVLNEEQKQYFAKNLEIDLSLDIPSISRFRVNIFVQRKGMGGVFRLIPEQVFSIDELGLPETLKQITQYNNGLVIVTGPTGSGKSTTLAAMLNEVNANEAQHIITIEDPIEFVHENKRSIIEQREIKSHTLSFQKALRSALREDPDVILVGEMRDLETIALAITAAETGHLVFATLHTSGAAKSVDRMIDAFPFEQQNQIRAQLSESLRAIIWQNLIKTKDGKGRVAPLEIMINNSGIANMIRKAKTHQINSAIETGFKEGMQTMKKAVTDMLDADIISEEAAMQCIPQEFEP
ncbi:MAG TPA: type IV pilus twitching motility protein PilT [Candidatus Gracilibacteria bacterium]|nr:type IV pilus twitching motility protein PilT [Candidatus Gracilibacteria bacterium]